MGQNVRVISLAPVTLIIFSDPDVSEGKPLAGQIVTGQFEKPARRPCRLMIGDASSFPVDGDETIERQADFLSYSDGPGYFINFL